MNSSISSNSEPQETHEKLLRSALRKHWGYSNFRKHQLEVCVEILKKRDVNVIMATGSGKSLMFQLPAIALNDAGFRATSVVICPLISLIEDQVASLKALGVSAGMIGGNASHADEFKAQQGAYTVLYATPEKICMWREGLKELAKNTHLVCLAIDESHCVR